MLRDSLQVNNLTSIFLGPNCPPIHSLMFADDLILCGKVNVQESRTIFNLLNHFYQEFGPTLNWSKSGILLSKNVALQIKQDIKITFPAPNTDDVHIGHPLVFPSKDRSATCFRVR